MAKSAKKTVPKLTKALEKKISGDLPHNVVMDKMAVWAAHNYMSCYHDQADAIQFLTDYLPKELGKKLNRMPKYSVSNTAGWIAKYIKNGCTVPADSMSYLNKTIKFIEDFEIVEVKRSGAVLKTYENNQIILLEAILDDILKGTKIEFDATNHFKSNETSASDLKAIKEYYSGCKEQLLDKGNKEYFRHSPTLTKKLVDFYRDIEDSVGNILNNKIRERKPRAVKAKPAAKLVSKLRFMKESAELKVSSLAETVVRP